MGKTAGRVKYLAQNTLIFTLGNIATKFMNFFLVPLYTSALSTAEYGTVDLITTLGYILAPVLVLNIYEGVLRFSLDKDSDYIGIISIGLTVYIVALAVGLLIFPINSLFSQTSEYSLYIYLYTITYAGCTLMLCYLRGRELLVAYALGNVIRTLLLALFNILFLLVWHMGVDGYLLAMILSASITMIYSAIAGRLWEVIGRFYIDKNLLRNMAIYSIVLIPNAFLWWILNASDRIMVATMVGASVNGIYAISYKVSSLINSSTTVFYQAWSYSAIKEEGATDETQFNNNILKKLVSVVMLMGIGMMAFTKPFLNIYVTSDYYSAWKYVPFLVIGGVYLALASFMQTSYMVHKDSKGELLSSLFSAVLNIILNFMLIPKFEVYGAAFATCVSYIAVMIFRAIHTRKYIKYELFSPDFLFGSILMLVVAALLFVDNVYGQLLQYCVLGVALVYYARSWWPIVKAVLRKVKQKRA